jgi:hypothetical protein
MKTILIISATLVACISLLSCQKEHQCTCKVTRIYNQESIYDSVYAKTCPESTKRNAKTYCNGLDKDEEYSANDIWKTDCELSQ